MKKIVDRIDDTLEGWSPEDPDAHQMAEDIAKYFGRLELCRLLYDAREALLQHMQLHVSTGRTGNQWWTIPPAKESQK